MPHRPVSPDDPRVAIAQYTPWAGTLAVVVSLALFLLSLFGPTSTDYSALAVAVTAAAFTGPAWLARWAVIRLINRTTFLEDHARAREHE